MSKKQIEKILKRNPLGGHSIVSVSQFDNEIIEYLYSLYTLLKGNNGESKRYMKGKMMTALFFEPSTRTSASFIAAMNKLGGSVVPITQGVEYSSISKGESFEDTIVTLEQLSDVIVLRHPEMGSAKKAAEISMVPIINAGDGVGEHPSQALLDLFTIMDECDLEKDLNIALVGDLRFGRTVHSLAKLIASVLPKSRLTLVSPSMLNMPDYIMDELRRHSTRYSEVISFNPENFDVVYMTRVQKERFTDLNEYEQVKDSYRITKDTISLMKDNAVIMHPLPRVGEIDPEIDSDPRAAYFRQVKNGLFLRMALLLSVLS